jgi:hypothetical protein
VHLRVCFWIVLVFFWYFGASVCNLCVYCIPVCVHFYIYIYIYSCYGSCSFLVNVCKIRALALKIYSFLMAGANKITVGNLVRNLRNNDNTLQFAMSNVAEIF